MKKELYDSPKIKVLSYQFEAIVCGSPTGFDGDGGYEEGGYL